MYHLNVSSHGQVMMSVLGIHPIMVPIYQKYYQHVGRI